MDTLLALVSLLQTLLDMIVTALRVVNSLAFFLLVAALTGGLFLADRMGFTFLRVRGQHHVLCPQNGKPATIRMRILRRAMSNTGTVPEASVRICSRWPAERGCEQKCLVQISWLLPQ